MRRCRRSRSLTRAWSPTLVLGLAFRRTRAVSALALLVPALSDWAADRQGLDPVRAVAVHVADDVAYGTGVWVGCARERTLVPLVPRVSWRSPRVVLAHAAPRAPAGDAVGGERLSWPAVADGTKATSRLPLAVLVSGAPGSGKTTLAASLGAGLDLPVVHKDALVHGIWRTRDRALDLGAPGVEPFYRTMELWAELGVSFVAEQTFFRGVSEPDVAQAAGSQMCPRQCPLSEQDAMARFERRMRDDALCGEARLRKLLPLAERLQSDLYEPLMLDCPLIVVDTDDGYTPPLPDVLDQIDEIYSRPLIHDLDRPQLALSRAAGTTVQSRGYPLGEAELPGLMLPVRRIPEGDRAAFDSTTIACRRRPRARSGAPRRRAAATARARGGDGPARPPAGRPRRASRPIPR